MIIRPFCFLGKLYEIIKGRMIIRPYNHSLT